MLDKCIKSCECCLFCSVYSFNARLMISDPSFITLAIRMAPPSYSDIGKQARDVFGKGYHFGLVKLEVKSKSASGLEFTAGGNTTTDGGKVSGSIESKMTVKEHGLKLTEKWNTDNSIGATVDYEKLMPGLKLTLDSSFQPNTGDKSGKFKTEYKHEKLIFNADMGLTKR